MSDPATVRWRLDIGYDGTDFSGWAAQQGLRTVQGELELWLSRVLRLAEPARLVCAGRTDAGVHARGQVAHVDLPPGAVEGSGAGLLRRLQRALPPDLAVTAVTPAPAHFDARFGAIWRRYCYRIADRRTRRDPLLRHQVADLPVSLDLGLVNDAGSPLLGLRDFAPFCRPREGASTIRTLLELTARRVDHGPMAGVVEVTVRADAFCHSMVRSLVGALVEVGSGRRAAGWLTDVAAGGQRSETSEGGRPPIGPTRASRNSSVPVLPARGLTLEEVGYPPDEELAQRVCAARSRREAGVG